MTPHRYRTAVAGAGIVYDGQSRTEAFRQFDRLVAQFEDERSATAAKRVAVFNGYDIVKEYIPPGAMGAPSLKTNKLASNHRF